MRIKKCAQLSIASLITIVACGALALTYLYQIRTEGTIELKGAPGKATITREKSNGIAHIEGKTIKSTVYA